MSRLAACFVRLAFYIGFAGLALGIERGKGLGGLPGIDGAAQQLADRSVHGNGNSQHEDQTVWSLLAATNDDKIFGYDNYYFTLGGSIDPRRSGLRRLAGCAQR